VQFCPPILQHFSYSFFFFFLLLKSNLRGTGGGWCDNCPLEQKMRVQCMGYPCLSSAWSLNSSPFCICTTYLPGNQGFTFPTHVAEKA
jgi:hypothetical protein